MEQWIQQILSADQMSFAFFPAVFLLGMLGSVTSCCTLPVVGAVAGYAGTIGTQNSRRELLLVGLFFMLGTTISLAIIGALSGFIGHVISASLGNYWRLVAGLFMVLFGLITLGLAPLKIPSINLNKRVVSRGAMGAAVYGLIIGGASTACSIGCNPLLGMVIGATVLKGSAVAGAAMFAVFALGYSLPLAAGLVGIGYGLGRLGNVAQRIMPAIRVCSGVLLIGVGFYLLITIR
jgi:cytochrome c biogenesis protein CcdA